MSSPEDKARIISELREALMVEQYDRWDMETQHRVFLEERLKPLLNDAVDALEIDPPAQGIALRRIKAALDLIK